MRYNIFKWFSVAVLFSLLLWSAGITGDYNKKKDKKDIVDTAVNAGTFETLVAAEIALEPAALRLGVGRRGLEEGRGGGVPPRPEPLLVARRRAAEPGPGRRIAGDEWAARHAAPRAGAVKKASRWMAS